LDRLELTEMTSQSVAPNTLATVIPTTILTMVIRSEDLPRGCRDNAALMRGDSRGQH